MGAVTAGLMDRCACAAGSSHPAVTAELGQGYGPSPDGVASEK